MYKYEVIAQVCGPDQMLNGIDWLGGFGHINCTSLVGRRIREKGCEDCTFLCTMMKTETSRPPTHHRHNLYV